MCRQDFFRLVVGVQLWCAMSMGIGTAMADEIALANISESEYQQIGELMRELSAIKRHDLFIPVARLQLLHLNALLEDSGDIEVDTAQRIRIFARGVAFNVASFTWPGWDDTGPISNERQELGLSAALVGLRLAEEADAVTPNILWINGVHEINAGEYEKAEQTLARAKSLARNDFYRSMHDGWIAMARFLADRTDANRVVYEKAVEVIRAGSDPDAAFYAAQLPTALDVFLREDTNQD